MPDGFAVDELDDVPEEAREDYLREAHQDVQELKRALKQEGLVANGDRRLPNPMIPRNNYMRRMMSEFSMDSRPDQEPTDDPFGDYLSDVAYTIEESADRMREQIEVESLGVKAVRGEVVCCVVIGLFELVKRVTDVDNEDANSYREVAESDVRKWILTLRNLLKATQKLLGGSSVNVSVSGLLKILYTDVTAMIMNNLYTVVAGLLFTVHEIVSAEAREIDDEISEVIYETRCGPLMRIWDSIFETLYGGATSILSRSRAFMRDMLLRKARERQEIAKNVGLGGQLDAEKRKRYRRRIQQLITLLDAILSALSIFDLCRVDTSPENRSASGDDGSGSEPRGDSPGGGGGRGPDGPGTGRPGGPGRGGGPQRQDSINDGRGEGGDRLGLTEVQDPHLGRVGVLEGSDEKDDAIYLTPTNIAKFMTSELGMDPEEAQRIAGEGQCQDELSEETEEILSELGLIDEQ